MGILDKRRVCLRVVWPPALTDRHAPGLACPRFIAIPWGGSVGLAATSWLHCSAAPQDSR